jgi:DNA polymerase-1
MNAPIQGSAADIMKIAMIDVFFRLKRENLKSRLILQIHDELVIETAPDEVDRVSDILKSEMEQAVKLSVPMEVDCHTGSDWYEAK